MNFQRILLALCVSLAVSSGFTLAFGRHLKSQPGDVRKISYIAPARPIAVGELLRAADLQPLPWPEKLPLPDASTRKEDFVGRTVLVPVGKGQPLLTSYVSAAGAGAGLAARIPTGMRAIAMRSDDVVGVGGFLNPGSHVDVLVTSRIGNAAEPSTVTALQNAEVIATGQRAQPDPAGKPESATVVTLLLKPSDAERAVLASTQGSIHFVLRNSADNGVEAPSPIQLSTLFGVSAPQVKPAVLRKSAAPTSSPKQESGIETVLDSGQQIAAAEPRGAR